MDLDGREKPSNVITHPLGHTGNIFRWFLVYLQTISQHQLGDGLLPFLLRIETLSCWKTTSEIVSTKCMLFCGKYLDKQFHGDVDRFCFWYSESISSISARQIAISLTYLQTSNISRTFVGYEIVDHSDVVGASPVGAGYVNSLWNPCHWFRHQ